MKSVNYRRLGASLICIGWSCLAAAQTLPPHGLQATYYNGESFEEPVVTRTDAELDFEWKQRPPATGVSSEHFSVRWMGFLEAPVSGVYTLQLTFDDGLRVWVGNRLLFESWRNQYFTDGQVRVRLEGGKVYALRIEYYQNALESRACLRWERPDATTPMEAFFNGKPRQEVIPTRYLWTALPVPPADVREAEDAPVPPPTAATPVPVTRPAAARPNSTPKQVVPPTVAGALPPRGVGKPVPPAPAVARLPAPTVRPDTLRPRLQALARLTKGQALTLPNLYFTQSTADLLPASRPVLDELTRVLHQRPTLRLEIAGHTDNVGDAALNLRLSEQRARVVRRYLVQRGVDSLRLAARGYGGTRPVANNQDPQQRPRNRRVEVVVR